MKNQNVRNRLIENTIRIIAENGFDKTTTKAIVSGTDINEAYIYRDFSDKEDLFVKVFDQLDEELIAKLMQHLPVMYMSELEFEVRCRVFFTAVWKFLLGNKEKCLAFVQYYYSPYFNKYSADRHKQRYRPLVEKFSEAFIDEADVWMILNHILNVMLDFAVKVHNDHMSKEDSYSEHVFRVIYRSVEQYFKKEEVNNND
ncbi:MAG: TetR/AcrR family transcriptional regulator [Clostridia bacterium]|nr:TetR/AcrR family transcriptional regulator [Clostridia bacterium]